MKKEKKFSLPTAFGILLIIIMLVSLVTLFIPSVTNVTIPGVVMSPVNGFLDAIDVILFVLVIGGFLGIVMKTQALDAAIAKIVEKLRGKEMIMIPILMFIFSIGGTTYGMAEETIAFYALIVGVMMLAKFDALVGAAVILLGAGVGCLGSTINPFAIGVAIDSLPAGVDVNQTVVIILGVVIWLTSYIIATAFVMNYANKVKANKEASLLSEKEIAASEKSLRTTDIKSNDKLEFTTRRKIVIWIFAISFVIMILSLIPWGEYGITIFEKTTAGLTGIPFGEWYFNELSCFFIIAAIIVGIIYKMKENEIVNSFVDGAAGMMSVVLVIGLSRAISVIMADTGLGDYILTHAADFLSGINTGLFTAMSYLVYLLLAFLIPSTSGLAGASMPIMGGLADALSLSPEVMIMIYSSACGVICLFAPTFAVVMGGLTVAKIEYGTWLKFVWKLLLLLIVANIVILSASMFVLS